MKIIQITPEFPPACGGIGHYVYYLSTYLMKMGHEVSVICRSNNGKQYSYEQILVSNIKTSIPAPFNIPIFKRKVENLLVDKEADIIHIHSTAMPPISNKCPVLLTAHWCNKKGISAFHRPICDLDSLYRNIMLPIYTRIERDLVRAVDKLTVVSSSLQKEFQQFYAIDSDIIDNGVDIDRFKSDKNLKKETAVLFAGKFCRGKGVIDLVNVAAISIKTHPSLKFYLIGKGPSEKYLKAQIKKRHLSNVTIIGQISHNELVKYYQRAIVFVLPSYYEGIPTSILEAMACELPVIASNVSGIPDQIEHGINGLLVKPGNVQDIYNKIIDMVENPRKRTDFAIKAKQKVLELFNWNSVARKIDRIYNEILEDKK